MKSRRGNWICNKKIGFPVIIFSWHIFGRGFLISNQLNLISLPLSVSLWLWTERDWGSWLAHFAPVCLGRPYPLIIMSLTEIYLFCSFHLFIYCQLIHCCFADCLMHLHCGALCPFISSVSLFHFSLFLFLSFFLSYSMSLSLSDI